MAVNLRFLTLLAILGSAALLGGAFFFQALGYAPCQMCLWQRWPHAIVLVLGALALGIGNHALLALGAAVMLSSFGLGLFHSGVEQGWWEGITSCAGSDVGGMSSDALFDQIMSSPLVRCDEIAWSLMGLSMAAWNALISLGLALLWLAAFRHATA